MKQLFTLSFSTKGQNDIVDLSSDLRRIVQESNREEGAILVFVPGATGGLSTIEYEPGLLQDLPELMEKLIPAGESYRHNETWQDGNGHSHLRATIVGPSLTIPFSEKKLILGTWQQVVFLEFDTRPRTRKIIVKILQ